MNHPFKDHFSSVAQRYANYRPQYPKALFAWLATLPAEAGTVWDCACGNGQASLGLAEYFRHVIATDASASQIAATRPHAAIDWRVASAEQSGLEDSSLDMVTVAQALHWLDLDAFYVETLRVLKPGGILAVWSYGKLFIPDAAAINALVEQVYSDIVGPYWPPERSMVENGYRDLPFPFPELAAPPLSMRLEWHREQLMGYMRSWSASGRYAKANGHDPLTLIETEMSALWPDGQTQAIEWPLAFRVGRKD